MRLLVLAIAAIFRPKALLIVENLCLRQQLVVLQRRHPRPRLSDTDGRFWILASRWFSDWRHPLLIVKPETVLGWQRAGWRAYWRWRSSHKERGGRPAISLELQALIARMAAENRLWGQKRIQAELARLGFQVSARTVAKYMRGCRRRDPTGTWREFLTQQASNMWACDFFCVPTVLFQTLHVFFVIRLRRRLCSFRTGAISLYLLRAARSCAARIMLQRYVERLALGNPLQFIFLDMWQL